MNKLYVTLIGAVVTIAVLACVVTCWKTPTKKIETQVVAPTILQPVVVVKEVVIPFLVPAGYLRQTNGHSGIFGNMIREEGCTDAKKKAAEKIASRQSRRMPGCCAWEIECGWIRTVNSDGTLAKVPPKGRCLGDDHACLPSPYED